MRSYLKNLLSVTFIIVLAGIFYFYSPKEKDNKPIFCTEEAKLCSDGSYVSRTGPNCEFSQCPEENVKNTKSGIKGKVLIGPLCPVVKIGEECPDKPYATRLAITTSDQMKTIKEFISDENGKFNIEVPPGEYAIYSAVAANVLPYCNSDIIKVNKNSYTDITVHCDTGIR